MKNRPLNLLLAWVLLTIATSARADDQRSLQLVVMDPLSKPLSCDCVQGYAQREYEALAAYLKKSLGRDVDIIWHQSLAEAIKETDGKADIVVGKHSMVVADSKTTAIPLKPVAQLTGKSGGTTQHGLIVVRTEDTAQKLDALIGYEILFGPTEAEEKAGAAEAALASAGVETKGVRKRYGACSEAATAMLKMPKDKAVAAVISSYAEPLLKGCGSIREGELRVVGRTKDVPFVTAFINEGLSAELSENIQIALLTAGTDPKFRKSMETLAGFVPWKPIDPATSPEDTPVKRSKIPDPSSGSQWHQFRGEDRNALVRWLPDQLPNEAKLVWSHELPSVGYGGLVAADGVVVVSGRDAQDRNDAFLAFALSDGKPLWQTQYKSPSTFDYGNTPRATPVINNATVFTFGAAGILSSLDLKTGRTNWQVDLAKKLGESLPTWGFCCSPLLIENTLYLQLGAKQTLVAVDSKSGSIDWSAIGRPSAYSSLMPMKFQGKDLLVGIDRIGYFIRSASDGKYLWLAKRKYSGDFGVPAPVIQGTTILFTGENNGLELFDLASIASETPTEGPQVANDALLPDSHTPVIAGDQVLVAHEGLHALDLEGLEARWSIAEDKIHSYAAIIASSNRALVATENNELLLVDTKQGELLDSIVLAEGVGPLLSHPAIANNHLLIRVGQEIRCYQLR
ncbi:MAG: PhnD/SsuA/transferrin family substrate-binding protein [Planctomycetota bacterium]